MVRLAKVGIGGYRGSLIGSIRVLQEQGLCRLVAAADTRAGELGEFVQALAADGVEIFEDAVAMFHECRGKVDGVYIASGIHSHAPLTVEAAACGYHVHVEKPPAATVQEVDAMTGALADAGRMGLVGFHQVHGHDFRMLKDRISAGRLGRIRTLVCRGCWPRGAAYYARNEWAGKLRIGEAWVLDGPANNALAHQINNLLCLACEHPRNYAEPAAVRAELYAAGPVESHNLAAMEIRTVAGVTAWCYLTHCCQERFGPVIEIEGETGRAVWDGDTAVCAYADGTTERFDRDDERTEMVLNFVQAVASDSPRMLRCTPADTRNYVLAIDGAHESSGRIHRADTVAVTVGEGDSARTVLPGIDALLERAAVRRCLPSDLPDAPAWAVATEAFDLAGYKQFPQRFACE